MAGTQNHSGLFFVCPYAKLAAHIANGTGGSTAFQIGEVHSSALFRVGSGFSMRVGVMIWGVQRVVRQRTPKMAGCARPRGRLGR